MTTINKYFLVVCVLSVCSNTNGLRILGLFPMYIRSHYIMCEVLMERLAERGHQVDVYSHYPPKKSIVNFNFFSLEGTINQEISNNMTIDEMQSIPTVDMLQGWFDHNLPAICDLMGLPIFQKLLHNPPNDPPYDLVIMELSGSFCYLPWGHHLNVPLVNVITLPFLMEPLYEPLGMLINPATDRDASINSAHAAPMSFYERLSNWFEIHEFKYLFSQWEPVHHFTRKYFGPNVPSVEELLKDTSLVLLNHNFALNEVRSLVPKVIPVGGLHIVETNETLRKEVKKWLDESKNGCIYFSFGSITQFESFSPPTIDAIYKSFENISPVRIILKADLEKLPPGLPSNVLTQSWLQQPLVLKHKNVKAFVTHGGLMGTQESVFYGVPMICIPVFGDQRYNTEVYMKKKIAIKINLPDMSEKTFTEALREIIKNPIYKTNVQKVSKIFRDRPLSPADTSIYWIEFIHRHGKDVLRSPTVDMPWWQTNLLDVYAFVAFSSVAILWIVARVCKVLVELSRLKLCNGLYLKSKND